MKTSKVLVLTLALMASILAANFIVGCSGEQSSNPIESVAPAMDNTQIPTDTSDGKRAGTLAEDLASKMFGEKLPESILVNMLNGEESDRILDSIDSRKRSIPTATSIGSYMYVRFPFGFGEEGKWRGVDGTRTGGGSISACGGTINSHSGADCYARDLSRYDGTQNGKPVYAGFSGYVVRAGDDGGYGKVVVIWDPSRSVCIRYAHLSYVAVGKGSWISTNTYIGKVGNSPGGFSPHLHIVGYEHVPVSNGAPVIPYVCKSDYYSCILYFWYYA